MYRKLSTVRIAPRRSNQRNESQDVSLHNTAFHAGPGEGTKLHARKNFCVFYPIELKLCSIIELFIPNNRIVFVF